MVKLFGTKCSDNSPIFTVKCDANHYKYKEMSPDFECRYCPVGHQVNIEGNDCGEQSSSFTINYYITVVGLEYILKFEIKGLPC